MFTSTTVLLHITLNLPEQEGGVYLFSPLSGWKPDENHQFIWTAQGYQLSLRLPEGRILECRVSLDLLEELDEDGLKRPPRILTATHPQDVRFKVLGFLDTLETPVTRTGHIEERTLYSPELQEEVRLLVYLPPQYFDPVLPEGDFPVLYMHDGPNVFDRATSSFGFAWEADEAAEILALQGFPSIVVGVWTPPEKRFAYYLPYPSRFNGFAPEGAKYLDFLAHTLKPHIDLNYRTRPDRDSTGICGSSLGGIISLYGAMHHPEVYGCAGVMSPATWAGEYRASLDVQASPTPQVRYYLDMGDREGTYMEQAAALVREALELAQCLSNQGSEVELQIGKGHLHHEWAWEQRFPDFLKFFLRV